MVQKYIKTDDSQNQPSHKSLCFAKLKGNLEQECRITATEISRVHSKLLILCAVPLSGLNGNPAILWSRLFLKDSIRQINAEM